MQEVKNCEGLKYDKGKIRIGEMIQDFCIPFQEICKLWHFGTVKYGKGNWKLVDDAEDRYTNAMIRHFIAEETEVFDPETRLHHSVHVAWNAIVRVFFILRSDNNQKGER